MGSSLSITTPLNMLLIILLKGGTFKVNTIAPLAIASKTTNPKVSVLEVKLLLY